MTENIRNNPKFGVIGAGGWGTALAVIANRSGSDVMLWTRNDHVMQSISEKRVNELYLPDVFLDPNIGVTQDLAEVCQFADYLILSVPSQYLRTLCISISDQLSSGIPVIIACKGIERGSLQLMSEVVKAILPNNPIMVLSGPNFAAEVAMGLPAAAVLASEHRTLSEKVMYALGGKFFRPYYSDDVVGVQVGGAVKNVVAIASGICMGKGLGENARSALLTRGLAEMSRLAQAKGGREETLAGLAGVGDLMLTASSLTSRNTSLGYKIGQGGDIKKLMDANTGGLSEGAASAESIYQLSRKLGVSMPISSAVHNLLEDEIDLDSAIDQLLTRPLISE